ncbi:MAG: FkbM family methyltransferase [Deltaproteobacteria bacterium]|nr:FkbM family methyltransferase [Deltaproteobacteria bacterium]
MIDLSITNVSIEGLLATAKKVVLFGAGGAGLEAVRFLKEKNIEVLFFCDNDVKKHGKRVEGVKVFPPEKLKGHSDEIVLISSDYAKEIGLQIKRLGVREFYYFGYCFDFYRWYNHFNPEYIKQSIHKIEKACSLLEDEQSRDMFSALVKFRLTSDPTLLTVSNFEEYYHPQVKPSPDDVIIDAGAWTGDTAISFSNYLDAKCKVFSFEPDGHNFGVLLDNLKKSGLENIVEPVKLGLWKDGGFLRFNDSTENSMQFRVDEAGGKKIEVVSLDEFINEKKTKVDLIKMDIEGSEFEAVKGCESILKKFAPKLQICIYHKADDLWEIPLLIKKINPKYKLSLGVHKQHFIDTILYAITD